MKATRDRCWKWPARTERRHRWVVLTDRIAEVTLMWWNFDLNSPSASSHSTPVPVPRQQSKIYRWASTAIQLWQHPSSSHISCDQHRTCVVISSRGALSTYRISAHEQSSLDLRAASFALPSGSFASPFSTVFKRFRLTPLLHATTLVAIICVHKCSINCSKENESDKARAGKTIGKTIFHVRCFFLGNDWQSTKFIE